MELTTSINLTAVVLLLAANAFFVAAEFALVKARDFRIDSLAEEGKYSAKLTQKIQDNLEAYLACCQLGITMASLGLGWVGEPAVEALLRPVLEPLSLGAATTHTLSFLIGFVVFSSLHIVVGEQVPKTLAIRKPEPVSLLCAIPLRLFYIVLFPMTWTLNMASRKILHWMGVEEAPHAEVLSGTEIAGLVKTSAEHGDLSDDKAAMIHNVFRFDERTVGRVMIPRVECEMLRLENTPEENIAIIRETKHSRFPVLEGENDTLVGIVLFKDLVYRLLDGAEQPWTDIKPLCREPMIVPESVKVAKMFDTMMVERAHMACVVDEYGTFAGIVTLEDLLEEIVGDISDELDDDADLVQIKTTPTGWTAHGFASLSDIERVTGLEVADDLHANTLSGLFMHRLERMPKPGDHLIEKSYQLTVDEVSDRHVELATIERVSEPSADDPVPTGK